MSHSDPSFPTHAEQVTAQKRARWIGGILLGAGLILSIAIFMRTDATDGDPDPYELNAQNSKRYEDQLERIGGKGAILGVEVQSWWDSLWHGRKLAYTVLTLSVVGSGLCFIFAQLEVAPATPPRHRAGGNGPDRT